MKARENNIIRKAFLDLYPKASVFVRPKNKSMSIPDTMVVVQGGTNWVRSFTLIEEDDSFWYFRYDEGVIEVKVSRNAR